MKIRQKFILISLSILTPLFLWGALISLRPKMVTLYCKEQPSFCEKSRLNPTDQATVGLNVPHADEISLWTQNASGVFAFMVPLLMSLMTLAQGRESRRASWHLLCDDWIFLLQTLSWNGVVVEIIRVTTQRPRPFVYEDPAYFGGNPWHYNSFVSGHTSFSAAMAIAVILLLVRHRVSPKLIFAVAVVAEALVLTTGLCRVLAGRHFFGDVVGAFIGGSAVALLVARARKKWRISLSLEQAVSWRVYE